MTIDDRISGRHEDLSCNGGLTTCPPLGSRSFPLPSLTQPEGCCYVVLRQLDELLNTIFGVPTLSLSLDLEVLLHETRQNL
jgi:hypothetical protein